MVVSSLLIAAANKRDILSPSGCFVTFVSSETLDMDVLLLRCMVPCAIYFEFSV